MYPGNGDAGAQPERSPAARVSREDVLAWMRGHLARLLGVAPDDLDPHEHFLDLGVDSVQAMALLEAIAEELQIALAPEVFFDYPTMVDLAGHLMSAYPEQLGQRLRPVPEPALPSLPSDPSIPTAPQAPSPASGGGGATDGSPSPALRAVGIQGPHGGEERGLGGEGRSPDLGSVEVRLTDIAIIGMAGRFPGAPTLDRFWQNLRDGVDSIGDVPKDRWNADAIYDPDPRAPNKSYLKQGGFLDDIWSFAPLFFHLSPREAAFIDPQQRLFLEVAWEAIETAGYAGPSLRSTRTGVYVGVSSGEFLQAMVGRQCEMVSYVGTGNSPSVIPNRISYHLNLRGPSMALDTACSSSLVAIHLACQSLARGETDYALAGAVSLSLHHGKYVYFSKAGMLASDGRCKTFDARANGYVPGEAVAAVVLKPLAAALRDRDTIHGVIRGVGVNQDGRTNGITAPSPRAQRELCQEVYEKYEIDPATISYVEAHGTGTPLGDPIEVSALTQAFGAFTDRKQFCGIGALKTNIGHTEPVAGVAGICKILLSFKHRQLPPTIHFNEVNPHIHFEETPFYLVDRLQEWQPEGPRRATVSAFSFGGVNAHVVLEEPPAPAPLPVGATPRRPEVVTLAAMTDQGLSGLVANLDAHLAKTPDLRLEDVAFTLNVGRDHFDRRLAFVVDSLDGLRRELVQAPVRIGGGDRAAEGQRRRRKARQPALVFGGEPSAALPALLALAQAEPDARALVDQAEALVGMLSPDAALFTLQIALARLWQSWGIQPEAVAGSGAHALAAAVVQGTLAFEAGLRRVAGLEPTIVPSQDGAAMPLLPADRLATDDYLCLPIGPADAGPRRIADLVAEVYLAGLDLDWRAWHRHSAAGRVPLPTYPFERQHIPPPPGRLDDILKALDANGTAALPEPVASEPVAPDPLLEGVFQTVRWQPKPLAGAGQVPARTYVVFADDAVAEPVGRSLAAGGSRVIRVLPGPEYAEDGPDLFRVNPSSPGDHIGLVAALQDQGVEPAFLHLWSCGGWSCGGAGDVLADPDLLEARLARGAYSLLALVQAIGKRRLGGPPELWVATTDGQPAGSGPIQAEHATIHGLMRTLGQEYPHLRCVHVDLPGGESPDALAATLLRELAGGGEDRTVAYRGGERLVPELVPQVATPGPTPIRLRQHGVYWITGGLGGVGRLLARHLAERVQARLVLSGRTVPPPRERWDSYLASASEDDPMARVIRDVRAIDAAGGAILILEADVAEIWQLRRAVRQIVERFGAIHGVIHAAGVLRDGLIRTKSLDTFREVLRAKVRGTLCLERALEGQPLDFLALCSSLAGLTGNVGQSDYATANAFLDALAHQRRRSSGRPYVSINWSLWESGGMGLSATVQQIARSRGIVPIDTATGTRALEAALALGLPQVIVGRFEQGAMQDVAQPARPDAAAPQPPVPAVMPSVASRPSVVTPAVTPQLAPPVVAHDPQPAVVPAPVEVGAGLREFAEDWLLGLIGPRLGVAVSDIDPETPFLDLGIDSIIAGEIALDAEGQLPVTFSPTMLLDYPTISQLADYLCESYAEDVHRLRARREGVRSQESGGEEPGGEETTVPSRGEPLARPPASPADVAGPYQILALSAASDSDLRAFADTYRGWATTQADAIPLDQLCQSAERADLPYRLAVVARSHEELARELAGPPEIAGVVQGAGRPRVAFLFTGQGAQYPRMAETLYRSQPVFRHHLDRCDEILRPYLDRPLLDLLYPADGGPRPLDQTVYTQPLTFAVDYCLAQLWIAWGVRPAAVIGHSVGEYAAACVAGVLSLEDALPLIARRARLMQDLPAGGAMVAVRADESVVRGHLRAGPGVAVAAVNSPTNVVLSSEERQLEAVVASLKQAGISVMRLSVSHAFHSALMEPILEPFEACFRAVTLRPPRIPLISNLTGQPIGAEIVEPSYWLRQLRQPVRFADGIRRLAEDGISAFLEAGPHTTLTTLARDVLGASDAGPLLVSSLARGQDDAETLLTSLGRLWVRGVPVDWAAFDSGVVPAPAVAPTVAANGVGQATDSGAAPTNGQASEAGRNGSAHPPTSYAAPPALAAPEPVTLFNTDIDSAHVSSVLQELRQGRLSIMDAMAKINAAAPESGPAPEHGP